MHRSARAQTAVETLAILGHGGYRNRLGSPVDLSGDLQASAERTRLIRPADWDAIVRQSYPTDGRGTIGVTDETTLAATHRSAVVEGQATVAALNFASAKNAGGGFRSGSQAQEESLARSSGLYPTLAASPAYYAANRVADLRYTDHAIVSPAVPVFRDDGGNLLDAAYAVTFVTMPAANVGAMPPGSPLRGSVAPTMARRARQVLAALAAERCRCIVLGAWGCGVFRHDPRVVAEAFAVWLLADAQPWRWCFDRIVFAAYDVTPGRAVHTAFADRFGVGNDGHLA